MYKIKYVSNFSDEMFVRDLATFITIDHILPELEGIVAIFSLVSMQSFEMYQIKCQ